MTHAVETFELERRFGSLDAVRGLDLRVPRGSVFALVGPNGAGKTTTLKMLMNLIRPSSGRASVLGTDSRRLGSAEFQRIGYVSENQELPFWMTPAELFDYCRPLYPTWDVGARAGPAARPRSGCPAAVVEAVSRHANESRAAVVAGLSP